MDKEFWEQRAARRERMTVEERQLAALEGIEDALDQLVEAVSNLQQ